MDQPLADRLCGAWRLVSWRIAYDDGRPAAEPFGPDPEGTLLYDRAGWMSATMSARRRSPFSAASAASASAESKARALDEYLAYTGRWWLDGQVIVHEVLCSLNPVLIGTQQRRAASFDGTTLVLAATEMARACNGVRYRSHTIRWDRA